MKKSFLILAGFFVGMLFIAETSSGNFSMPIHSPLPQTAQRMTRLEIPEFSDTVVSYSKNTSKKKAPSASKKAKLSESYADQLSALRYVMRSA
jgi:hypothetical protein